MKKLFIAIFFFILIPYTTWAACSWTGNSGTVASPYDHSDVQACVNDAAGKTGDIIITIPAATVNWDDRVVVNMATWTNVTGLTLNGANESTVVITDTGTNTTLNVARLFQLTTTAGKSLDFGKMTLKSSSATNPSSTSGLIYVHGTGTSTRLHHITIPELGASNMGTGLSLHEDDGAYGVVDSCTFTVPVTSYPAWTGNPIKIYGASSSESVAWKSRAFTPGSANAWYIENNLFTLADRGNGAYDAYTGARVVFRYNTVHGGEVGGHGNDSSGTGTSVHTQETYNNTFDNTCGDSSCNGGSAMSVAATFRGGTGVMFNNVFGSGISTPTKVSNYRSNTEAEGTATNTDNSATTLLTTTTTGASVGNYLYNQTDMSHCLITSIVAGTSITCSAGLATGTDNHWDTGDKFAVLYYSNTDGACDGYSQRDGNIADNQGWLCRQQVGSTYDLDTESYIYKPIYAWGNTFSGTTAGHLNVMIGASTRHDTYHVKENQTYFNCASAADCKTATDAVDVPGFGLNQGWTYTAYTCPHPLVGTGTCIANTAGKTGYLLGSSVPTIVSATIGTNGTTLTLVFSEAMNATAIAGLSISVPSGPATLSLVSGSGTTSLVTTISRTITAGVTGILLSYAQPGNEIESSDDQTDLASFDNFSVTNGSEQNNTVHTATPSASTGCSIFPSTAQSIVNGLTTQFTYSTDQNYQFSSWGGTCGGSGTTTYTTSAITADCTVIANCTKIAPDYTLGRGAAVTLGTGAVGTIQ